MKIVNAPIEKIAIENPIGIMSKVYRKPDQIIQPYFFGDEAQKTTCLWLKNMPKLYHNKEPNLFDTEVTHVGKGEFTVFASGKRHPKWYADAFVKDQHGKKKVKHFTALQMQWQTNGDEKNINYKKFISGFNPIIRI